MNWIKREDLKKGFKMEEVLKPIFENKFGELKHTKQFDNFDFENDNVLIELKTRNVNWGQYPSLMFSMPKLRKAEKLKEDKNFKKKIYIFWKLKNGLYYWEYNKNEYKVDWGGRTDRGCDEIKEVVYIKNEYIKNYNDLEFPEGYWDKS